MRGNEDAGRQGLRYKMCELRTIAPVVRMMLQEELVKEAFTLVDKPVGYVIIARPQ